MSLAVWHGGTAQPGPGRSRAGSTGDGALTAEIVMAETKAHWQSLGQPPNQVTQRAEPKPGLASAAALTTVPA